jgi:hypothetical protein
VSTHGPGLAVDRSPAGLRVPRGRWRIVRIGGHPRPRPAPSIVHRLACDDLTSALEDMETPPLQTSARPNIIEMNHAAVQSKSALIRERDSLRSQLAKANARIAELEGKSHAPASDAAAPTPAAAAGSIQAMEAELAATNDPARRFELAKAINEAAGWIN